MKKVSVVIPAYNEEKAIEKALEHVTAYFVSKRGVLEYEVVVVNDGSTDRTAEVVRAYLDKHREQPITFIDRKENKDKGYTVMEGTRNATGDFVLFLDTDLATPVEMFDRVIPYLESHHVIIGSRRIPGAEIVVHQALIKELAGRVGNFLIQLFLLWGVKDTQCGFKVYDRQIVNHIFPQMKSTSAGQDFETLYLFRRAGYEIQEVPVTWNDGGDSRFPPSKYIKTLVELLRIRWRAVRGKYDLSAIRAK